ncbi:MAG: 23S rRNA (uracil(1939)-C(5))-methyltransferase RlmD [Chitinophagaceae bacterium]|nr:23S rRNA (uracil(1939)-C(5))-methyltransferase RlmD [Chitinophagaceae bacterium]
MRKKKQIRILQSVTVEDYAAEGRSLARVDGKVVFIEGAVPGDVVDVQLGKSKKDWAEGRAVHFHTHSQRRATPFCSHFGLCGGCKWQMLPYADQLQYKQKEVEQNLKRIGKLELPPLLPIIASDATRYYRNKLEFTFSSKKYLTRDELIKRDKEREEQLLLSPEKENPSSESGGALGFHVPGVFDKAIDIDTCYLQPEPSNAIRNFVRKFALLHQLSFYNIKEHTGWLRTMIIRTSTTGEAMVNITMGYDDEFNRKLLLTALLAEFPEITTLLYTINPKWNDSIYDLTPQVFYGNGYIIEHLEDFVFKVSPKSFFQTNTKQAEQLYRVTRNFAQLSGTEILYDLYCGTGSIGIFCSKGARQIVGVETVADAIEDAKENAALNGLTNTRFYAGDVIDICNDDFFALHGKPDVIITDPPRAGMHEKLVKKLLDIAAPRIVYVSCNTATQARDLQLLGEKYTVEQLQPVDMFPHTHHIENVAALALKG